MTRQEAPPTPTMRLCAGDDDTGVFTDRNSIVTTMALLLHKEKSNEHENDWLDHPHFFVRVEEVTQIDVLSGC